VFDQPKTPENPVSIGLRYFVVSFLGFLVAQVLFALVTSYRLDIRSTLTYSLVFSTFAFLVGYTEGRRKMRLFRME